MTTRFWTRGPWITGRERRGLLDVTVREAPGQFFEGGSAFELFEINFDSELFADNRQQCDLRDGVPVRHGFGACGRVLARVKTGESERKAALESGSCRVHFQAGSRSSTV